MVHFEENKLVIEIETGTSPVEYWQDLQRSLLEMLRSVNQDAHNDDTFYLLPDFLAELIPDWEDAKKMSNQ